MALNPHRQITVWERNAVDIARSGTRCGA